LKLQAASLSAASTEVDVELAKPTPRSDVLGIAARVIISPQDDRSSGHANRVRVLDRFLACAKSKPSVWFARKDEIAKWAVEHRSITSIYDRGAPTVSGLQSVQLVV
jgi:hypothetical protein